MKKAPSNNHSPWELRSVPPVQTYFTDQALPPDGYIETDQALPVDDQVDENLDCSYLLRGLWPEAAKEWFVWNEGEKPRAVKVAVNIEKLCGDYDIKKWWRKKIVEFVKFKAAYDEKKVAGKYVDPHEDWPFEPCHPREISLPGDLPALYAILCRFHDWLPGFDQLFSEGDPAEVEFSSCSSTPNFEQSFEQRPVRIEELEKFLIIVKQDIEDNHVCRHLVGDEKRGTPDEDVLPGEHPEFTEVKEDLGHKQKSKRKSKKEKIIVIATCLDNMKNPTSTEISEVTGIDESDVRRLWRDIKTRMFEGRVRKPEGYKEKNGKIEAVDESATCKICDMPLKSTFECGFCKEIITGECKTCHFTNTHPKQAIP